MVVVPAGSFTMGSPPGEKDRDQWEEPQQVVTTSGLCLPAFTLSA
jgi:formylglycine-generating enzyme required for sulfatase activity